MEKQVISASTYQEEPTWTPMQKAMKTPARNPNRIPRHFPFRPRIRAGSRVITEIEPGVIAAIAGHVAKGVEGVDRLGGSGGIVRTFADTIRSRSSAMGAGIDVEAGRKEAILDIGLIVDIRL